ncbi:MAG: acyl carrier protein [Flavobacterium sp.]|jgi:acyl carrier protein
MVDQQFLSKIKSQVHYTNCFVFENELFDQNKKCVFETELQEGIFCFYKNSNYNFKHLNFYVNESKIIENKKINWKHDSFVTEIISVNSEKNHKVKKWLLNQDNFHYRSFFRMIRTDKTVFDLDFSKVQHPDENDLENIILHLEKSFDKHTERIPNLDELKRLQKSSYVIKDNNKIAAVLITEFKGANQELNFMVTLPEFEGKGYGRILMNYVFTIPNTQRWVMWVDSTNERVLDWYYNMGYKKDKLENNIYISKKIMIDIIKNILLDTRDEFDFNDTTVNFVEAGYLDSFDIISIVVDLESAFDVKISGALILPENFKSLESIANLIQMSKDAS